MIQRFMTSDGLALAYDDAGTGAELLCLAGLSRNMADFEPVVAAFGGACRLIRLDYRGRGQSDWAPDWTSYTIPREAQDVLELLDHLGLEAVSILGTSRGGLIAMTLAAMAPARLTGAVLVDIGPELTRGGLDKIKNYIGVPPGYASYEDAADKLPAAMAPGFAHVPRATWRAYAERVWVETESGLGLRYDPALREAVVTAFEAEMPDLWPLFDLLAGRPLGLIRGAKSDLLTAEAAAEMRRRRPDMLFADVPDRAHVPFLDEPEAQHVIFDYLDALR